MTKSQDDLDYLALYRAFSNQLYCSYIESKQVNNVNRANQTINLLSPLQLLWQNLRYVMKTYFLSHVLFTSPYMVYLIMHPISNGLTGEVIVFSCLIAWFGNGLYKTRQPKFVAVIAILFIWSQQAYFAGNHQLDIFLTVTCILLMCVKQYCNRYYFAILQQLNDSQSDKDNARNGL